MVKITSKGSWLNGYKSRATVQITATSDVNSEHILHGIHGGKTTTSLIIQIGKSAKLYLSTFGNGMSKEKSEYYATSSLEVIRSLIPGCKFTEGDLELEIKRHSALIIVVGQPHIGYKGQTNEIFNGLTSVGIEATMLLNIKPLAAEEIQIGQSKEAREKILTNDCAFLATYAIFLTNNDPDLLANQAKTVITLLGSVYDSEHSNLKVIIESDGRAVRTLEKIIWGDLSYATILTTRELVAYLQMPAVYGVEELLMPEIYVPPPTAFSPSGIKFGDVVGRYNERLGPAILTPDPNSPHSVLWGATGKGKSTCVKNLTVGFHNQYNYSAIIFDHHNEYRTIVPKLRGVLGNDILDFNPDITPFTINPLELPPGLPDNERNKAVLETKENFMHTLEKQLEFVIGDVQRPRLEMRLDELYHVRKMDAPIISELAELLKQDKITKTKKDEDTLPVKLSRLTTGFYGEIFNKRHTTLPFEAMEKAVTIFELGRWPVDLRAFFSIVFLTQWWNHRITKSPEELDYCVVVLDEFHHFNGIPVIRKMLSEGRKYKIILICSHQGPFQLTDKPLLGDLVRNTGTKIIFKLPLRQDIELALSSIGVQDRKWFDYLARQELGEAIVTLPNISQPFKIITDPFPETEKISDDTIREKHEQLLKVIPQEEVAVESGIGVQEKEFLQLVHENEFSTASAIINQMRIMRSEGYKIKNKLVEERLVSEEVIRTGKGRPKKILRLTDDGYNLLGVEKEGTPAHYGGDEHRYMIEQVAAVLSGRGWRIAIERDGCDVKAMYPDGKKVAVEVETCKEFNQEQIIKNIEKNLKWADKVIFVAPNAQHKEKIQNLAKQHGFEKVDTLTYSDMDNVEVLFRLANYSKYIREKPEAHNG